MGSRGLGKLDELICVGVAAGRVVETCRKAESAVFHRFPDDGLHVLELGADGGSVVPADGPDTDGGVAEDVADVDGDVVVIEGEEVGDGGPVGGHGRSVIEAGIHLDEAVEVLLCLEGGGGVAVDADKLGGDTLPDLGLVERLFQDGEAAVGVDVDESGGDDVAGCVNNSGGLDMGNVAADDLYVFASNADTGVEAWASCVPSIIWPLVIRRSSMFSFPRGCIHKSLVQHGLYCPGGVRTPAQPTLGEDTQLSDTRFGIITWADPRTPVKEIGDVAREAEAMGFSTLWVWDTPIYTKDAYVALTVAAQATEKIRLGPGVSNPLTRHASVIANGIATLDDLSDGRDSIGDGEGGAGFR